MANGTKWKNPSLPEQSAGYMAWLPGLLEHLKDRELTEMKSEDMRDWLEERLLKAENGELATDDPFYEIYRILKVRILLTETPACQLMLKMSGTVISRYLRPNIGVQMRSCPGYSTVACEMQATHVNSILPFLI